MPSVLIVFLLLLLHKTNINITTNKRLITIIILFFIRVTYLLSNTFILILSYFKIFFNKKNRKSKTFDSLFNFIYFLQSFNKLNISSISFYSYPIRSNFSFQTFNIFRYIFFNIIFNHKKA